MKIERVRVENYRNLPDVTVELSDEINYLIGENNIGKSNFVDLLDKLFNGGSLEDTDYLDYRRPIRVELTLSIKPGEARAWGEPAEKGTIGIICTKDIADVKVSCQRAETGQVIPQSTLRRVNYYRDDVGSEMAAHGEEHPRIGAFMLHLIRRYLGTGTPKRDDHALVSILGQLNSQLSRMRAFEEMELEGITPDAAEMLTRLIFLLDASAIPAQKGGGSLQYSAIATMNVVNRILMLYDSKSTPLDSLVYTDEKGRRILPMVLALEEPEVHLPPYMQRSLIRYYKRIMSGQDAPFLDLLKSSFDLDGLDGQLFIITHSADTLVDNFRSLIRFYKDSHGRTRAACGAAMRIGVDIEKHLIMQFPDIKEAFYARCALLVEGTTESSALRLFAETMAVPLDDFGICVIDSGGEGNLRKLRTLLSRFGVLSVLMFDGDVYEEGSRAPNEFYTDTACFETEIADALVSAGAYDLLESIITQMDEGALTKTLTFAYLEKALQKFGATKVRIPKNLATLKKADTRQTRMIYAAWLYKNKGAILGRIIGDSLPRSLVPASYQAAILRAKSLAENTDARR